MSIEAAKQNMISQQARAWGVLDQNVLDLLARVPRDYFVPAPYTALAFADTAIPLDHHQQMLSPKEEARIIQALHIQPNERILEIGTGSGYFTALLAQLGKHVDSVDIFADFTEAANSKLSTLNIHHVKLHTADAANGFMKQTHFDVIAITGSLPFLPEYFQHQLTLGGRLFAIIGDYPLMQATLITRVGQETWQTQTLFETLVKPLINAPQNEKFVF